MEIKTTGFDVLNEQDRKDFEKLSNEYSEKLLRKLKNISSLAIHLKDYSKEGKRSKYSIHARVLAPTKRDFKAEAFDWDFKRTLHKVFKKLENEIEHEFHAGDEHKR